MIGTDIIEVARIEKLIKDKGDKFLNKIYTQNEIDYCESKGPNKYQHYAGRFAAKEAVYKAVAHYLVHRHLKLKDIEIWNATMGSDETGPPHVKCSIISSKGIDIYGNVKFNISISHIEKYALAFCTTEKKNPDLPYGSRTISL
jgi:holo-[acyl-carrier protein] synthase